MKTAIVTGGAGFIGSHLCEYLIKKDFKVICVDNYITGTKKNIEHLLENSRFELIEQNITEPLKVYEKIDFIFNLASPASPIDYQNIPIKTMMTNSIGVKNMLDLALKNDAVFLQASTSEVYGDPLEHPQKETYFGNVNPIGPRACYDEGKRFAEALIVNYARMKKLKTRIVRIFNTYGPRMRKNDGRVVPNFIEQCLTEKDITIFGNGKQTRSFCFVTDLVKGIYKLSQSDYNMPVNIGNPQEITMNELAETIKKLTKSKSTIVFKELPEDDPIKRKPNNSLAKKLLNWEPKIPLEEGLKKTINAFKE